MVNEIRELFEFVATNGRTVLSGTSRAASSPEEPKHDVMITEVIDGLIVTRPARKYTNLSKQEQEEQKQESESEPVVIELGGSKAGSVPRQDINEIKELFDFMHYYGRL